MKAAKFHDYVAAFTPRSNYPGAHAIYINMQTAPATLRAPLALDATATR